MGPSDFGAKVARKLDADRLATVWARLAGQVGRLEQTGRPVVYQAADLTVADIPLSFEAAERTARIAFDRQGKVALPAAKPYLSSASSTVARPPPGRRPRILTRSPFMPDQVFRCADGHLFTASWLKMLVLSVHLVDSKWTRCPVDHRWRTVSRISPHSLSQTQLREATQNRFQPGGATSPAAITVRVRPGAAARVRSG